MRYARTDTNHSDVVAALRSAGWCVRSLAMVGMGMADAIAGKPGINVLVEIKRDAKEKLTQDQITFHSVWPGPLVRVNGPEDAVAKLQGLLAG